MVIFSESTEKEYVKERYPPPLESISSSCAAATAEVWLLFLLERCLRSNICPCLHLHVKRHARWKVNTL